MPKANARRKRKAGRKTPEKRGRPRGEETAFSKWMEIVGISRAAMAKQLGLSRSSVDAIANGSRVPSLSLAFEIEDLSLGKVALASWRPWITKQQRR